MNLNRILLWTARLASAAVIFFVLFFLLADIINGETSGDDGLSTRDLISMVFFPIGALLGLILSFFRRKLGSLIAIGSMLILLLIRPDLLDAWFLLAIIFIPAFLWLYLANKEI